MSNNNFVGTCNFVLAFKTEEEFNEFKANCDAFNYPELKEYVEEVLSENNQEIMRKESKEVLQMCYYADKYRDVIVEKVGDDERYWKFFDDEEYQKILHDLLIDDKDYMEQLETIENAHTVCSGFVFADTGGFFEWAICDGFLAQEPWTGFVVQLNLG